MDTPLNIERVSLDDLHQDPANARTHGPENLDAIVASLKRFGQVEPLVVQASTGRVIGGNGRVEAMRKIGWTECDIVRVDVDDLTATALGIALNRSSDLASWNDETLARLLQELRAEDSLSGVGFDDADIDKLLRELEAGAEAEHLDDPGAQDLPTNPVTRLGDLWICGDHRVFCGDARDAASWDQLFGATIKSAEGAQWKASCLWSDPPYGVSYQRESGNGRSIQGDTPEDLPDLLPQAFAAVNEVLAPGAAVYVAGPSGPQSLAFLSAFTAVWHLRQTLVWIKDSLVLGHADYHYRHEPILFGYTKGAGKRGRGAAGWWGDNAQTSVFEFPKPKTSPEHPCMKPIELIVAMLRNSTGRNHLVLDPFLGSGSTMMACESLGRRCYGTEIDPAYVDAMVKRWAKATGKTPILDGCKTTFQEVARQRGVELEDESCS